MLRKKSNREIVGFVALAALAIIGVFHLTQVIFRHLGWWLK